MISHTYPTKPVPLFRISDAYKRWKKQTFDGKIVISEELSVNVRLFFSYLSSIPCTSLQKEI